MTRNVNGIQNCRDPKIYFRFWKRVPNLGSSSNQQLPVQRATSSTATICRMWCNLGIVDYSWVSQQTCRPAWQIDITAGFQCQMLHCSHQSLPPAVTLSAALSLLYTSALCLGVTRAAAIYCKRLDTNWYPAGNVAKWLAIYSPMFINRQVWACCHGSATAST